MLQWVRAVWNVWHTSTGWKKTKVPRNAFTLTCGFFSLVSGFYINTFKHSQTGTRVTSYRGWGWVCRRWECAHPHMCASACLTFVSHCKSSCRVTINFTSCHHLNLAWSKPECALRQMSDAEKAWANNKEGCWWSPMVVRLGRRCGTVFRNHNFYVMSLFLAWSRPNISTYVWCREDEN